MSFSTSGDGLRTGLAVGRVALANSLMRMASLGGRFLLSIYIVRYLGFSAAGSFGIVAGIAGFSPALCGFGISYFVNREIVSLPRPEGYRLLRDRLVFNLSVAGAIWLVGLLLLAAGLVPPFPHRLMTAIIITLEFVAFDLHVALINLRRPVTANFLLFVRSASWIAPFIVGGLSMAGLRSLEFLLACWLAALALSFALLPVVLGHADLRLLMRTPIDWRAMIMKARSGTLIYVNDIAASGQVYFDRFIVLKLLGLASTGLYTLCFSVTHGLYVLVATAVTQLSMPKLVAALDEGGHASWRHMLAHEGRRAFALAIMVVAGALVATLLVLPALGFDIFRTNAPLFMLMAVASLLKPIADLLNTGLYSLGLDRMLALINLGGILASACLAAAAIMIWGIIGVGWSSIATVALLIVARAIVLARTTAADPRAL